MILKVTAVTLKLGRPVEIIFPNKSIRCQGKFYWNKVADLYSKFRSWQTIESNCFKSTPSNSCITNSKTPNLVYQKMFILVLEEDKKQRTWPNSCQSNWMFNITTDAIIIKKTACRHICVNVCTYLH